MGWPVTPRFPGLHSPVALRSLSRGAPGLQWQLRTNSPGSELEGPLVLGIVLPVRKGHFRPVLYLTGPYKAAFDSLESLRC